jgi:hypothetical protein
MKFLSLVLVGLFLPVAGLPAQPEKLIIDTDVGMDLDDAAAMGIMHALMDLNEIEVLAIGVVNGADSAVPYLDALNTWYGRPDLPIGVIKMTAPVARDLYTKEILDSYPHDLTAEAAPDAVTLYRQVLAAQPDRSVTLVAMGAATNIADLLNSPADGISPLTGRELLEKKLKLYIPGGGAEGKFPKAKFSGNYRVDQAAARTELDLMPSNFPMIYVGGDSKLRLGTQLTEKPEDHFIRRTAEGFYKGEIKGFITWDQVRLLYAARPALREKWELSAPSDVQILDGAYFEWTPTPDRGRAYANLKDVETIRKNILELLTRERTL